MSSRLEELKTALKGQYEIERELGAGGMATVYLADDIKHQRQVAIKVLRPDLAAALGPDRFLREIRIAANLTHPHILPLHDSGEAEGFLYYVMPFIEGQTLRDRIDKEGELPIAETIRIIREVTDALAFAHSKGVVHRDIKPDNIMLTGGHAIVADFGVAKAVSEATGRDKLTTAGVALGTPAYMSPEQATADPHVDHRADIYAVGAMAYELLAGRTPFTGATPQAILAAHVTQQVDPVSKYRDQVSSELEAVIMRCLAKKPADRWQSADEILPHLEGAATASGGLTPASTIPVSAVQVPGRRFAMPMVALAMVVTGALYYSVFRTTTTPADVVATRLAVFPFPVSGSSDEAGYLREGLVHLLSTALDGAGDIRTVDPQTVLSAAGEGALNAARAREVADGAGAGMFILGSVTQVGPGRIQVGASLYDRGKAEPISARVTGQVDEVLSLTGDLARQLLVGYSAALPARIDSLALLTTDSIDALKAYLNGMNEYRNSRWTSAIEAFETAVAIDSTFALAYYFLSRANSWDERHDQSVSAAETAMLLSSRLSPRYVDLLGASLAMEQGRPEDAERFALRVVGEYPGEFDGWYLLGETRLHFGPFVGRPFLEAKEAFDRAVAIDPGRGDAFGHAYDLALATRDIEEVEKLYRLWESVNQAPSTGGVSAPLPLGLPVARLLARGDTLASDSILAVLGDLSFVGNVYWGFRTGSWWGDIAVGTSLFQRVQKAGATPTERALGNRLVAEVDLQIGKRAAAVETLEASSAGNRAEAIIYSSFAAGLGFPPVAAAELRSQLEVLRDWDPSASPVCLDADPTGFLCAHEGDYEILKEYFVGIITARLGNPQEALNQASVVEGWDVSPDDPTLAADLAHGIRALVAQLDRRSGDALSELQQVSRTRDIVKVRASAIYSMAPQHFTRAEALNGLGRGEEAMRWYTVAADISPVLVPAAHLRIGEIHEAAGEIELAVERYSQLVDMWSEADPEYQPLVEDVRGRISRLVDEK